MTMRDDQRSGADLHGASDETLRREIEAGARKLRAVVRELALAETRERREIACELHDHLGQVLAVIALKLGALANLPMSREVAATVDEVRSLVEHTDRVTRSLVFQLHPPVLDALGLIPALAWLVDEMQRIYGLAIELTDDDAAKPLGAAERSILFRAVRELLINAAKHAGVGTVRLITRRVEDDLEVVVSDAGTGFDPAIVTRPVAPGFGLLNVRERLAFVGGSATIASALGMGTTVMLRAPLQILSPEGST